MTTVADVQKLASQIGAVVAARELSPTVDVVWSGGETGGYSSLYEAKNAIERRLKERGLTP